MRHACGRRTERCHRDRTPATQFYSLPFQEHGRGPLPGLFRGRPLEQRRTSGGKAGNSTFATPGDGAGSDTRNLRGVMLKTRHEISAIRCHILNRAVMPPLQLNPSLPPKLQEEGQSWYMMADLRNLMSG